MREKNSGITLIALIITIIVMLILVAVTINMAVNGGLFGYAGNAAKETKTAMEDEKTLGSGIVDGKTIDDWVEGGESLLPNTTLPAGGVYLRMSDMTSYYSELMPGEEEIVANIFAELGYTGVTLNDSFTKTGEIAPEIMNNDAYYYNDYVYAYTAEGSYPGWVCILVGDKTKSSYGNFLASINGKELTHILPFRNCSSLTTIPSIPSNVKYIGDGAFAGCTNLTHVTIPNNIVELGDHLFDGCTSLTSVTIPDNITRIVYGTFYGCTSLISFTFPNGVSSIESDTFNGCTSLSSITIPTSVTRIETRAFWGCTSLTNIIYQGTKSQWESINLESDWDMDLPATVVIHCTDGDITL